MLVAISLEKKKKHRKEKQVFRTISSSSPHGRNIFALLSVPFACAARRSERTRVGCESWWGGRGVEGSTLLLLLWFSLGQKSASFGSRLTPCDWRFIVMRCCGTRANSQSAARTTSRVIAERRRSRAKVDLKNSRVLRHPETLSARPDADVERAVT